jgi:hypothetical protein
MDHRAAAAVIIASDRLVVIEGAIAKGGRAADFIANRAPSATPTSTMSLPVAVALLPPMA